jgi:Tfp pilus assembly protein PilF
MDALKRAELAKQQGQTESSSGLSLERSTSAGTDGGPETLPSLSRLEDLDEEFISHSAPARSRGSAPLGTKSPLSGTATGVGDMDGGREAIRNAFAVKNGLPRDRQLPLILAFAGIVALGVTGVWLWLQFKPAPGPSGPTQAERQMLAESSRGIATTAPATSSDMHSSARAEMPSTRPARSNVAVDADAAIPPRTSGVRAPVAPVPALPSDASIRVTTSHANIASGVAEGYRLLQTGDLVSAKKAYNNALSADPRNSDALHGLAAIALQQGRVDDAESAYRQILEANPVDASAQAGLIGLSGQDPLAAESRLKSLLATQGDQPAANFALGNLYAKQQRWNEAQQAYFKATTGDAGNPDYLFNLAVSLDQIHQPKLAAQYYSQALAAAEGRPVAFDTNVAARRLHELRN